MTLICRYVVAHARYINYLKACHFNLNRGIQCSHHLFGVGLDYHDARIQMRITAYFQCPVEECTSFSSSLNNRWMMLP